jgi:protein-S-isoprenylcysteine O-methyltransferase Ste14
MRIVRTGLVAVLIVGLASSSFAGDLRQSVAAAAAQQQIPQTSTPGSSKAMAWAGGALFAGGMAIGLFAFMNNQNGEFTEFGEKGEANAVNKPLGAAGISMAFAGGLLMYFGTRRASQSPSIVVHRRGIRVVKQLAW